MLALAGALLYANAACAQTAELTSADTPAGGGDTASDATSDIVVTAKQTRSATALSQTEIQ